MKAEIIAVGTEILLGDIVNTNARYLSRRLADLGISVYHQTVVGDNPERIKDSFKLAFTRSDMVITTGGLGPTKDDITKEMAAEFFNKDLVVDEFSLKKIEQFFVKMNRRMTDNNKKQAYMPQDSIILINNNGTAPGCVINENGKIIIVLPGPPKEMTLMFENEVVPYLKQFQDGVMVSKVLRVLGLGESLMEDMVKDIMDNQTNPTIAPYAKDGEAILRITAKGKTQAEAQMLIVPVENQVRQRLGDNIYGIGDTNIESVVAQILIDRKLTISTAESCTGGLVAAKLINCPGISSVFMEGMVTYSNESKMKRLNVKEETLQNYGAVSVQTAGEMALGIAKSSNTDIGISTTGIAGPDGGTQEKPVGLVYVGLYIMGTVKTRELRLWGDRQTIRNRTSIYVLDWLSRELIKEKEL